MSVVGCASCRRDIALLWWVTGRELGEWVFDGGAKHWKEGRSRPRLLLGRGLEQSEKESPRTCEVAAYSKVMGWGLGGPGAF